MCRGRARPSKAKEPGLCLITMQHNCITAMELRTHRAGNGVLEKGEAARVSHGQGKVSKSVVSPLTVVGGDELSSTLLWSYKQPERDNSII